MWDFIHAVLLLLIVVGLVWFTIYIVPFIMLGMVMGGLLFQHLWDCMFP